MITDWYEIYPAEHPAMKPTHMLAAGLPADKDMLSSLKERHTERPESYLQLYFAF